MGFYSQEQNYTRYGLPPLANALFDIGVCETGTSHLEQAVEAYKKALTVLSPSKTPEQWQETEDNLKTTMETLHDRGWKG
jgi:hypothetical protein